MQPRVIILVWRTRTVPQRASRSRASRKPQGACFLKSPQNMARKYFYFDYDYYGVSFCEEEITSEPEERVAYTAKSSSFTDQVAGILKELFCEGHQSSIGKHSYQGCGMTNTQDTKQEEPEKTSEQSLFRIPRNPYKFTPGQLWELQAVFEETQYPGALRRCVPGLSLRTLGSFSSSLTPLLTLVKMF